MTDDEFYQFAQGGFREPPRVARHRIRKGGRHPDPLPESVLRQLEQEGHVEGFSKSEARFHGALGRIFGSKPGQPTSPETIAFVKSIDSAGRALAKFNGIDLIED